MPAGIPSVASPAVGEMPLFSETRSKGSWVLLAVPVDTGAASWREHPVTHAVVTQANARTTVKRRAHHHLFMNVSCPLGIISHKSQTRYQLANAINHEFNGRSRSRPM